MPPTLLEALSLETLEMNLFRGRSRLLEGLPRIFGGQVVAQALLAAYATVEGRLCHSLHGYFLRPGDPSIPIVFEVDRARDGGSFTVRRVTAVQRGRQIFNMAASFQTPDIGLEHQSLVPPTASWQDTGKAKLNRMDPETWPLEFRPVERGSPDGPIDRSHARIWLRVTDPVPADPRLQQVALAYASDATMLSTSLGSHGLDAAETQCASLDHALWFHRPIDVGGWHLFDQVSPSTSGGRGLNLAQIFSADGALVATCTQEGLIRPKRTLAQAPVDTAAARALV